MKKIKLRLPATLTQFSPGLSSIGLAVGLYVQVDFIPRTDSQFSLALNGTDSNRLSDALRHPISLGMMHVFQRCEQAPTGVTIRASSDIPLQSGLGAEAAYLAAGIIGANNLIGLPFRRDELVQMAGALSENAAGAITSILGGMTTHRRSTPIQFKSLPVAPLKVVIAMPQLDDYRAPPLPDDIPTAIGVKHLERLPFFLDAMAHGDMTLLRETLIDDIYAPTVAQSLRLDERIQTIARDVGAIACTTGGTTTVFFVPDYPERLADLLEIEYRQSGRPTTVRVVPIDTQGLVMSMMQLSS